MNITIDDYILLATLDASEVNKWWFDHYGYKPPYRIGTTVKHIKLKKNITLVRVYDGINSKMKGGWFMDAESIDELTPAQIQDRFSLSYEPRYRCKVNLIIDNEMRRGIANAIDGCGSGGGLQYDAIGKYIGDFVDEVELIGAKPHKCESINDGLLNMVKNELNTNYEVCDIKTTKGISIVLLDIPTCKETSNIFIETENIYGFINGKKAWKIQSILDIYPDFVPTPFVGIIIDNDGRLIATDFNGCRFSIDIETGKILEKIGYVR